MGDNPTIFAGLEQLGTISDLFLSNGFMTQLLRRLTAQRGRPRVLRRSCDSRFANDLLRALSPITIKVSIQAAMYGPVYLKFVA